MLYYVRIYIVPSSVDFKCIVYSYLTSHYKIDTDEKYYSEFIQKYTISESRRCKKHSEL